jgi:hypothetical protein
MNAKITPINNKNNNEAIIMLINIKVLSAFSGLSFFKCLPAHILDSSKNKNEMSIVISETLEGLLIQSIL